MSLGPEALIALFNSSRRWVKFPDTQAHVPLPMLYLARGSCDQHSITDSAPSHAPA